MSGSWSNPNSPNLADFTAFLYGNVGIPTATLPEGSVWPGYAFDQAMALVAFFPTVASIQYVLAVYNCGAHLLIMITPDQAGQTYFTTARDSMNMLRPVSGILSGSSDVSTSQSFTVGDGMSNMTIGDLNFYTTPWGRQYLAYAQDAGPGLWGLS